MVLRAHAASLISVLPSVRVPARPFCDSVALTLDVCYSRSFGGVAQDSAESTEQNPRHVEVGLTQISRWRGHEGIERLHGAQLQSIRVQTTTQSAGHHKSALPRKCCGKSTAGRPHVHMRKGKDLVYAYQRVPSEIPSVGQDISSAHSATGSHTAVRAGTTSQCCESTAAPWPRGVPGTPSTSPWPHVSVRVDLELVHVPGSSCAPGRAPAAPLPWQGRMELHGPGTRTPAVECAAQMCSLAARIPPTRGTTRSAAPAPPGT